MKTVTVSASKTYDIKIGPGLISSLGQEVKIWAKPRRSVSSVRQMSGPSTARRLRKV